MNAAGESAVAPMPGASAVRERLRGLEATGARTYAPCAFTFAETLVTRGEAMGGQGGARLIARASARAELLARELGDTKTRAKEAVSAAGDPSGARTRAIDAGDVATPLRAARKLRMARVRSAAGDEAWTARLTVEMRARLVPFDANAVPSPGALASALYASSRAELSAMLVAIHAQAEVHIHAGPYNPVAIAARALGELSTMAPAYLTAIVAYLDELAPLLALPSPTAPTPDRPLPTHGSAIRRKKPAKRPG